jgi:hypothetical protein
MRGEFLHGERRVIAWSERRVIAWSERRVIVWMRGEL